MYRKSPRIFGSEATASASALSARSSDRDQSRADPKSVSFKDPSADRRRFSGVMAWVAGGVGGWVGG